MNLLNQGLSLSALGLGLTFGALGLFILTLQVLKAIFPASPPPVGASPVEPPSNSAEDSEEVIAAIALALAHFQALETPRGNLGEALETGPGAWWGRGRLPPWLLKREEGQVQ